MGAFSLTKKVFSDQQKIHHIKTNSLFATHSEYKIILYVINLYFIYYNYQLSTYYTSRILDTVTEIVIKINKYDQ